MMRQTVLKLVVGSIAEVFFCLDIRCPTCRIFLMNWRLVQVKLEHSPSPAGVSGTCQIGKNTASQIMRKSLVAALLCLTLPLLAADKSPKQILNGKPAATHTRSSRYSDGNGSSAGRSQTTGTQTRIYRSSGGYDGRVESTHNGTRLYDSKGAYSGRTSSTGNTTQFYDKTGRSTGRSITSGSQTRYYDASGKFTGREQPSGSTTMFYDASGRSVGSRRK